MKFTLALMSELEDALATGAPERRVHLLRRITDLFLNDADRLNEQQIAVFDDVLTHLVHRIEARVLAQLSTTMAPVKQAPINMIKCLASDDNISVAGPVLTQSNRISEPDLIEIAKVKGQDHLLAISARDSLSEKLTDALINRGDRRVMGKLARNAGARFSSGGFAALVKGADGDDHMTESLGLRLDIPLRLLKDLLARATNLVRSRLLAVAPPERQKQIVDAMSGIVDELELQPHMPGEFASAESAVTHLNREGKLNERVLLDFADNKQFEEVAAALALFCAAPAGMIEKILCDPDYAMLLLACKTAKLSWPTVESILRAQFCKRVYAAPELEQAKQIYFELAFEDARLRMRFMSAQEVAKQAT